jgi:SynChlorMet cassette radical SAM/SPASM protein ScmF
LINPDYTSLPEGVPPLNSYYVYLTSGCNLACRHCYLSPVYQPNGGTGGHLDIELLKVAIQEGLTLGLTNVKLTGGEPLLHPQFVSIIDFIRESNLNVSIETNGTLLTPSLAKYLKEESTLTDISISLDGSSPEMHDAFRGVKGSFAKATAAIGYLVEAGIHPQIIMSVHSGNGNQNEIEALVKLAEKSGAGSVKFNLVQPSGRGEMMNKRGEVLDIQQLIELGEWIENDLQKRTSISLHYSWPIAFHSLHRLLYKGSDACGIFSILGILATGQMAMCGVGVAIPELCYGLVGKDRVADIWCNHPTIINLRSSLPRNLEGICGSCLFRQQCLGYCVAENYHHSNNLAAPFWFCEQAENLGFFPKRSLQI